MNQNQKIQFAKTLGRNFRQLGRTVSQAGRGPKIEIVNEHGATAVRYRKRQRQPGDPPRSYRDFAEDHQRAGMLLANLQPEDLADNESENPNQNPSQNPS